MQKIPSTPFAFLIFSTKLYKKLFFFSVLCVVLATSLSSAISYSFKGFVDAVNMGAPTSEVLMWALVFPVVNLICALLFRASDFAQNYLNVSSRMYAIRSLFDHLSLHSASYFNDRFSGALSEKVNIVAKSVNQLVSQFMYNILALVIDFIVVGFILFSTNSNLALAFVGGVIVLVPINIFLTKNQKNLSEKSAELTSVLRGNVVDTISNITAVQQFSRRTFELKKLDKDIRESIVATLASVNNRQKVWAINNVLVGIFVVGIMITTFYLWSGELITVGSFVLVATLTRNFLFSLTNIGTNLNSIADSYAEMRNGLRDLSRPHDIVDKPSAKKLIIDKKEVAFDQVTFAYDKDPRRIFENLSFSVKGGEKIGVVGTSGAGKTTVMKLLLRQHDLTSGSIEIDGQNISAVTQESLRENVSIVPQEPMLFHRTIRENIMYGKLDATEEEMIEVAKKAQAHDFIESLPQKYDSLVGERGVKLSVGQRQRIAIARAFLKDAPILILDEATSALDSESEVAVQIALATLMEGKTVFAIAHRLSTLREMDRILVFKDGKVVEDGTHRTLLKNKEGVYASFWAHQAGGFIKED